MKATNVQKLENFFGEIYRNQIHGNNSVNDFLNWDDYEENELSFDWLIDFLRDSNFFYIDVMYYSNAIDYLSENDASLRESLEIADEYGYKCSDLNSEILASLLKSRYFEDEFYSNQSEIEQIFEEIQNEEEEEEEEEEN
jgi:hypothetical protein